MSMGREHETAAWTPTRWSEHETLLVVGKGPCVWDDVEAFWAFDHPHDVCCLNHIGFLYPRAFRHWYAHDDDMLRLLAFRPGLVHSCRAMPGFTEGMYHVWNLASPLGGSAVQATRLALAQWGYGRIVWAGIPLDTGVYKQAFLPVVRSHKRDWSGRVKSMRGATRVLLGEPTKEWLAHG
jgi:hypothetical protein